MKYWLEWILNWHLWDQWIQVCANKVAVAINDPAPRGTYKCIYMYICTCVRKRFKNLLFMNLLARIDFELARSIFGTRGFNFAQIKSLRVLNCPTPGEDSLI